MRIPRKELPWLLGAILFGGAIGPALLMWAWTQTDGATASLLLNVEGRTHRGPGVACVQGERRPSDRAGDGGHRCRWRPAVVATGRNEPVCRRPAHPGRMPLLGHRQQPDAQGLDERRDARRLPQGTRRRRLQHRALAWAAGASLPGATTVGSSLLVGFFGYGLSLMLFVIGLRGLGAARTGAYFSVAPLFGVLISVAIWPRRSRPVVLGGRRADGSRRMAARARASPARAHPSTARAFASPSPRRASPTPARLRVERR